MRSAQGDIIVLDTSFLLFGYTVLAFSVVVGLGAASYNICLAGLNSMVANYLPAQQRMQAHAEAVKGFWKATLGLLFVLAVFVVGYTIRNDLLASDPDLQVLKANPSAVLCGDTPENLCTTAHLKYLLLRP